MLLSPDFIDPKLARRLNDAHTQLQALQHHRTAIANNSRITTKAKQKLLKYNEECMKDLLQLLHKHQQFMIDYFDTQVNVLTKRQIDGNRSNSYTKTAVRSKGNQSSEVTKITLNEERYNQDSLSSEVMKVKYHHENGNSTDYRSNKFEHLNTTDKLTVNLNSRQQRKANQNHQFVKTVRHFSLDLGSKQIGEGSVRGKSRKEKKKTSMCKIWRNRALRRIARKQFDNQVKNLVISDLRYEYSKLQHESEQDKELISLLYKKIELLESNNRKNIQIQKEKVQKKYMNELQKLRNKYIQLHEIREQNQILINKKKQILNT